MHQAAYRLLQYLPQRKFLIRFCGSFCTSLQQTAHGKHTKLWEQTDACDWSCTTVFKRRHCCTVQQQLSPTCT